MAAWERPCSPSIRMRLTWEKTKEYFSQKNDSVPDSSDQVKFCTRVATKMDYAGDGILETIAYYETHFRLDLNFVGEFSTSATAKVASEDSGVAS
mmetsp:Transcript_272/g.682  ORF Transcript_272/g.682 Transcript_272/m.682 type:complete len:95 (+) Transcript_272:618-902(+)